MVSVLLVRLLRDGLHEGPRRVFTQDGSAWAQVSAGSVTDSLVAVTGLWPRVSGLHPTVGPRIVTGAEPFLPSKRRKRWEMPGKEKLGLSSEK